MAQHSGRRSCSLNRLADSWERQGMAASANPSHQGLVVGKDYPPVIVDTPQKEKNREDWRGEGPAGKEIVQTRWVHKRTNRRVSARVEAAKEQFAKHRAKRVHRLLDVEVAQREEGPMAPCQKNYQSWKEAVAGNRAVAPLQDRVASSRSNHRVGQYSDHSKRNRHQRSLGEAVQVWKEHRPVHTAPRELGMAGRDKERASLGTVPH